VDDLFLTRPREAQPARPEAWLGTVVPKRHARRAVTRTLLKRQIRASVQQSASQGLSTLRPGLWVVRLRAGFDRGAFPSASSDALRNAAREELDAVVGQAVRKLAVVALAPARRS